MQALNNLKEVIPLLSVDQVVRLSNQIKSTSNVLRAARVRRWYMEWPRSRIEKPATPDYVLKFEEEFGASDAALQKVLNDAR